MYTCECEVLEELERMQFQIPTFDRLPVEIIHIVFKYFTFEEKKSSRLVCKVWNLYLEKMLRFNIPPLTDETLPWIVNCRQKIRNLVVRDFVFPVPNGMILLQAHSVRGIVIENSMEYYVSKANMQWVINQCCKLKTLEIITNITPNTTTDTFSRIEVLQQEEDAMPPTSQTNTEGIKSISQNIFLIFFLQLFLTCKCLASKICNGIFGYISANFGQQVKFEPGSKDTESTAVHMKDAFDCKVVANTHITTLSIFCTHWDVKNLTLLPASLKYLCLNNASPELMNEFCKIDPRKDLCFSRLICCIIDASDPKRFDNLIFSSSFKALTNLPRLSLILMKPINLEQIAQCTKALEFSQFNSFEVGVTMKSNCGQERIVNTSRWLLLKNSLTDLTVRQLDEAMAHYFFDNASVITQIPKQEFTTIRV